MNNYYENKVWFQDNDKLFIARVTVLWNTKYLKNVSSWLAKIINGNEQFIFETKAVHFCMFGLYPKAIFMITQSPHTCKCM